MPGPLTIRRVLLTPLVLALLASGVGCRTWWGLNPVPARAVGAPCAYVPKELNKVSLPPYVIEPPDILLIDAVRTIPRGPYKVAPLDALVIQASGVLPTDPIAGIYTVDPDGTVSLGLPYRSVKVAGLTLDQVRAEI